MYADRLYMCMSMHVYVCVYRQTDTQCDTCMKTDGSAIHIFNAFNTIKRKLEKEILGDKDN